MAPKKRDTWWGLFTPGSEKAIVLMADGDAAQQLRKTKYPGGVVRPVQVSVPTAPDDIRAQLGLPEAAPEET